MYLNGDALIDAFEFRGFVLFLKSTKNILVDTVMMCHRHVRDVPKLLQEQNHVVLHRRLTFLAMRPGAPRYRIRSCHSTQIYGPKFK